MIETIAEQRSTVVDYWKELDGKSITYEKLSILYRHIKALHESLSKEGGRHENLQGKSFYGLFLALTNFQASSAWTQENEFILGSLVQCVLLAGNKEQFREVLTWANIVCDRVKDFMKHQIALRTATQDRAYININLFSLWGLIRFGASFFKDSVIHPDLLLTVVSIGFDLFTYYQRRNCISEMMVKTQTLSLLSQFFRAKILSAKTATDLIESLKSEIHKYDVKAQITRLKRLCDCGAVVAIHALLPTDGTDWKPLGWRLVLMRFALSTFKGVSRIFCFRRGEKVVAKIIPRPKMI